MPYRPDIDGLRAVAVLAVVLYHAFPTALPGGFVGVDIFFVISGFLITGIIADGLAAGRFSFAHFYVRRVLRIFPALALVLAAVLAYGAIVLLPSERALLGRDVAGGAGFVANLVFWFDVGYFDRDAATKPLLHLWSLGVEEQFYIVWPLALWALHRTLGLRLWPLAALAAASFAANLALTATDAAAAFYAPVTRFWELALGALLALAYRAGRPAIHEPVRRDSASFAGLALILLSVALVQAGEGFPGWRALLPTLGATLLIAAGPEALVNRRLLSLRPMVAAGLISYPLYLWHWPLLSYAHIVLLGQAPKPLLVVALLAASFALAWLTWRLIEKPLRFGRWRNRAAPALAAAMVLIGAAGLATWRAPGNAALAGEPDTARINAAIGDGVFRPTPDMRMQDVAQKLIASIGPTEGPGVLLVGDSVLFQYGPRAQALAEAGRLPGPVLFVTGPSCAPFPGLVMPQPFTHCTGLAAMTRDVLARNRIGTVILGAFWTGYLRPEIHIEHDDRLIPTNIPEGIDAVFAALDAEIARLRTAGHRVVLLLPPPAHPDFDPRRMVERSWHGYRIAPNLGAPIPVADLAGREPWLLRRLAAIAARHGAELRDPVPAICGPGPACPVFFGQDQPRFADDKHLRPAFVATHVTFLDDLLCQR